MTTNDTICEICEEAPAGTLDARWHPGTPLCVDCRESEVDIMMDIDPQAVALDMLQRAYEHQLRPEVRDWDALGIIADRYREQIGR